MSILDKIKSGEITLKELEVLDKEGRLSLSEQHELATINFYKGGVVKSCGSFNLKK